MQARARGLAAGLLLWAAAPLLAECLDCHPTERPAAEDPHAFLAERCSVCHSGDPNADELSAAHAGLRGFPGQLANAQASCGGCHPAQ